MHSKCTVPGCPVWNQGVFCAHKTVAQCITSSLISGILITAKLLLGCFHFCDSCPSRTRSRKVAVANWSWVPRRPGRCRRGWRYTVSESDTAFSLEVASACSRSQNLRVRVGHAPGRLQSPSEVGRGAGRGRCRRGWCYTVSESDTAFSLEVARVCSRSLSLRVRVGHAPGRLPSPGEVGRGAGQVDAAEGGATPCPSRTRHSVWRSPRPAPGR